MPEEAGYTGLDVARAARAIDPTLPVVLVSGFLSRDLVLEAKELGVRLILDKPLSSDDLCGAVAQALAPLGAALTSRSRARP